MPIVQFHLVEGQYSEASIADLLVEASHAYVAILYPGIEPPPIDRARAFVTFSQPSCWATAGQTVAQGGSPAPYFVCLTLAGRPVEQLEALLEKLTLLIATHLDCDPALVRGQAVPVDPSHWCIGGKTASQLRSSEIALRQQG